ncbi:MAG: TlpA family protein disulfide reductase [Candidatus Bipolaricaulota bacterium]|nr:MAG: TlpA family protein disulfide reductase [Candidatus Bipolaricaulota bacterium]
MRGFLAVVLLCSLLIVAGCAGGAFEAQLEYIDPITDLTGACFPQGMKLDREPPDGAIELPEAESPLYGVLTLAGGSYAVAVDMLDEPLLYVDADQDGELSLFDWEQSPYDGRYIGPVPLQVYYQEDEPKEYSLVIIWDPWYPTVFAYCRGAYYQGTIELNGTEYLLAILDQDSDGRYDDIEQGTLFIDVDGDGELLAIADSHEIYGLAEPFNLDGTTYEVTWVSRDGSAIRIEESELDVPQKYPLGIGFPAPPFEGEDLDGEHLSLESLAGSIIVLDFWAGWCSPCIAELPTLTAIHEEHAEDDVVVLGINLDRTHGAFEEAVERYEIVYPQIYDGGEEIIATHYRIAGIPMTYIIDRDGLIVARGLRGETLKDALKTLLEAES